MSIQIVNIQKKNKLGNGKYKVGAGFELLESTAQSFTGDLQELRWDHASCVWGQKGVTGRQGWGRSRSGQRGKGGAGRAGSKP